MGKQEIEALLKPGVKIVVTVSEWIMTPDGDYYKYFFGSATILSEEQLCGFVPKKDAGWYLVLGNKVIIPGCKVMGVFLPMK